MERISRMWRSGLSLVLALCLIVSMCPVAAFATENDTVKYVSLGDSMTNGYGLPGYDGHGSNGFLEVAPASYPAKVAENYGWELTQLATSAMRVEDLNYILGGNFAGDEWTTEELLQNDDRWGSAWALQHGVANTYVNAVSDADVITMAAGNGNFGVFLLGRITNALGLFGSAEDDAWIHFEDALSSLDAETQAVVMSMYNKVLAYAQGKLPADLAEPLTRAVGYTLVSFVLNYNGVLDRIVELNPDAEIIIVGLMNTMSGYELNIEYQGKTYAINMEQILNLLIQPLNAYLAVLPAAKQAMGEYADATIYYADVDSIAVMSESYRDLYMVDGGNNVVRDRFVEGIGSFVGDLMPSLGLGSIELSDVLAYEANYIAYASQYSAKAQAVAAYLGLEEAVLAALEAENLTFSLDTIMNSAAGGANEFLGSLLGNTMAGLEEKITENAAGVINDVAVEVYKVLNNGTEPDSQTLHYLMTNNVNGFADAVKGAAALKVTPATLVETLQADELVVALLNLYGRLKMGDGLSAHPSAIGHDQLTTAIVNAYDEKHTVQEDIKENVEYALDALYGFLEEYGPEAAEQVYQLWCDYGYDEVVGEYVDELKSILEDRYTHYTDVVLPQLSTAVDTLTAEKDNLTAQLSTLKTQLAEKKAELEKVLSEQEISTITPPDIDIEVDPSLGENEQTQVPENDCEGAGNVADELEAAVADLEHAISVIEALITDVTADIEDMVALATEIAEAVAALEETMADVAAAAEDLNDAFNAVVEVLTNESAQSTANTFINAFNSARNAALTAAEALELIVEEAGVLAEDIDKSVAILTEGMEALYNHFDATKEDVLGEVISMIPEDVATIIGASIMVIQQTLEENEAAINAALEAAKGEVLNKLTEEVAALEAEYTPKIAEAQAALNAKMAEIQAEIDTKYQEAVAAANAEIAALEAEAQAQLDALNAELQGYVAELEALAEDASEEVRATIQAQIDRVTTDIETVSNDLACAIEHVNEELAAAYDAIVEEVNNLYAEVVAELEAALAELQTAFDEAVKALEEAADKAIEDLIADAEKAIEDLIAEAEKKLEELGALEETLSDLVDGILEGIRGDVEAAQKAIEEILNGSLEAVKDLGEALVDMGIDAVQSLIDEVTEIINDLLEQATTADLELSAESVYVALGDTSAMSYSYVDVLAAQLKSEYGVETVYNHAEELNTVAYESTVVTNRSGITEADLITIGFSNVTMLDGATSGATVIDWDSLVGAENVPYVEQIMAAVDAKIAESVANAEMATMVSDMVEAFAYSAVEYAVELPSLISEIRSVNSDAVIVVVGQYNPMEDVVLSVGGGTLDVSEYVDYFVDAVTVHGIAYALISGDAIFVEAPDVDTTNTDTDWSYGDLIGLLRNGFAALYPSDEYGDPYVANQILGALNISEVPVEEPVGLLGDVNDDGVVNVHDLTRLAKYFAGTESYIREDNSDVNADGKINVHDLTRLAQYFAGLKELG